MHPTHNTSPLAIREEAVVLLNRHLAAAIDLHGQLKQAHWNVRGLAFIAVHELFDKVAGEVEDISDQLAERAGALGGTAQGTIQVAVSQSFLVPYRLGVADERQHIFAVAAALAAFGQSAREAITLSTGFGDADTADLFTAISRGVDRQLWFVESHTPLA
jgi:starvation-inducible DNA-binding protein